MPHRRQGNFLKIGFEHVCTPNAEVPSAFFLLQMRIPPGEIDRFVFDFVGADLVKQFVVLGHRLVVVRIVGDVGFIDFVPKFILRKARILFCFADPNPIRPKKVIQIVGLLLALAIDKTHMKLLIGAVDGMKMNGGGGHGMYFDREGKEIGGIGGAWQD
jgi:hypothetical protein